MAENRSHGESYEKRLARFKDGHPIEIIETLLNSIDNYFNNEIKKTIDEKQSSLLFLGIHSVALTISEALVNLKGPMGYKYYLKNFLDGETDDLKFSEISEIIHNWRNILAHQWLGKTGHTVGYDYNQPEGWKRKGSYIMINPRIYCEQYLKGFSREGNIWNIHKMFKEEELELIKQRLVIKFEEN